MKTSLPANKRLAQPHHAYNVFFTLERLRLIDKKTPVDATSGKVEQQTPSQSYDLDGYESLVLPDIPPRYQHLQLPTGWFVPGKNSNRKHTKSNEPAALPFFELARTIAANYKTVDKETKVFCETVSKLIKQRHADLTAADKLGAQEGLPKKKVKGKELPLTLVEGDVVPRVQATAAKTRSDTKLPTRVLNAPVVVHSPGTSTVTSNLMTRTNSTDSLGTFAGSGASQESNKNGVTPPPFWQNYPDVQRRDRIQEMDIINSSDDIHAMMTEQLDEYRRYKSVYVSAGFDADKIARENMQRDANLEAMRTRYSPPQLQDIEALRHLHQDDMHRRVPRPRSPSGTVWPEVEHPVIANVNRRASIMADMMREKLVALTCKEGEELSPVTSTHVADMMRARLMALTCKEEEETHPETQINLPGPPFHLPLCQPIQNDHDVSMLCQPTND